MISTARTCAAIVGCAAFIPACTHAQPLAITFRNIASLGSVTTDQNGQSFTVTGMSGIARRAGSEYWAIMDNSNKIVRLSVQVDANGAITAAAIQSGLSLSQTKDFEGIAFEPATGDVWLSEETTPAVRRFNSANGQQVDVYAAPPVFAAFRSNRGLESLTTRVDAPGFWTANEEALTVDGPISSPSVGTTVRLVRYDSAAGTFSSGAQYAYLTQPWHGTSITNARSGVSDMLTLPDGKIILLERSLAASLSGFFQTRIYELDFTGATDVSPMPGLIGQTYTTVSKRLLYQGDQQNLEGLTLGPKLGPGRYSLLGIVDDGDAISVNRVVAFEISGIGMPPCYANCDASSIMPILNANDFACFLTSFAQQTSYANCDGSSIAPVLNANDFSCFLNQFAAGCVF